jgi:hypothetical protein
VDNSSTLTLRDFIIDYVHFEGAGGASSSSSPSSSTAAPSSPSAPASPPLPTPLASPPPATPRSPTPAAPRSATPAPRSPTPAVARSATPAPHSPAQAPTPPGSAPAASARQRMVELTTPLSNDEDRIDAYHDGEPLRYRTVESPMFGVGN